MPICKVEHSLWVLKERKGLRRSAKKRRLQFCQVQISRFEIQFLIKFSTSLCAELHRFGFDSVLSLAVHCLKEPIFSTSILKRAPYFIPRPDTCRGRGRRPEQLDSTECGVRPSRWLFSTRQCVQQGALRSPFLLAAYNLVPLALLASNTFSKLTVGTQSVKKSRHSLIFF